jgi:hypothetical protein
MERDSHPIFQAGQKVDAVFAELSRRHITQRIKMASLVLERPLLELYDANQQQVALFESYVGATISVDRQNYEAALFGLTVQLVGGEFSDELTDIEKAEQALTVARINVQVAYDLNERQVRKAERLSRKNFDNNRPQPETSV